MASAAIDHMISITIFLAALLLFINMFSQTNETAIVYQRHKAIATKCSDLLDSMLLAPGNPSQWGQVSGLPNGFGLQNPEFTQYQLSPFSAMRLKSNAATSVSYEKTSPKTYYNNVTLGFGNSHYTPVLDALNYSLALKLLGINGTYGFQLELTPILDVEVTQIPADSLQLSVGISGNGFPLSHASISYCLILVTLPTQESDYPSYTLREGSATADTKGYRTLTFEDVTNPDQVYAFIAYAHLNGLVGVGSCQGGSSPEKHIVPIVNDMSQQKVVLAHSDDFNSPTSSTLKYNATFMVLTEDFSLREMPLSSNITDSLTSGIGNPYKEMTIPTYTPGILIIPYQQSGNPTEGGVVMMPWGVSPLAFPVTFGGDPSLQEWVASDLRQVTINQVSYQAKLSLWSSVGQMEVE